jgi:hypothetical protein
MTYLYGGKQYLAIAVGANADAEIVSLGLAPRDAKQREP